MAKRRFITFGLFVVFFSGIQMRELKPNLSSLRVEL